VLKGGSAIVGRLSLDLVKREVSGRAKYDHAQDEKNRADEIFIQQAMQKWSDV